MNIKQYSRNRFDGKSRYNPIAAITCANKWMGEEPFDLPTSHPSTSKRLLAMYNIYM